MTDTFDFKDGKGAVPAHRHTKGGGWVADTATVATTAYVGPDARVCGSAVVCGSAKVSGNAVVCGSAEVSGSAKVYGNAQVYGDAWVSDTARVFGSAKVYGSAKVSGDARVRRGEYNFTPTSITRSDGYTFTLQSDGSIVAGCRYFTPKEADEYWGNPKHHKHVESMAILTALRAIDAARKGQNDD